MSVVWITTQKRRLVKAAAAWTPPQPRTTLPSHRVGRVPWSRAKSTAKYASKPRKRIGFTMEELSYDRFVPPTLSDDDLAIPSDYEPDIYDQSEILKQEMNARKWWEPSAVNETHSAASSMEKEETKPPMKGGLDSNDVINSTSNAVVSSALETADDDESTPYDEKTLIKAIDPSSSIAETVIGPADNLTSLEMSTAVQAATVNKETIPETALIHAADISQEDSWVKQAAYGTPISTQLDLLISRLDQIENDIYAQNNEKRFNINSPKQVSKVLFGVEQSSTKKEVLEAMAAAGNRMAALILQYRDVKNQISRAQRKQESIDNGTKVKSASVATISTKGETVTNEVASTDPLLLVDASAYIFRAYYSMPPIHRYDGMPTGAVMGFCNMLNRLILNRVLQGEQPRLVLVFDAKGSTFRHEMYPDYKGHRPDAPMDLIPQFALIRQAADAYGISAIEADTFEADDVIATLATMAQKEGLATHILSGDKDLMQLISEDEDASLVHMIDPMTMSRVTSTEVRNKWGVPPMLLGDVLALTGDSSDNVPGVPGIGPKIAAALIEEFGNLDNLLENIDKVKQTARRLKLQENTEKVRLSRQLVQLIRDVPREVMTFPESVANVTDLRMKPLDPERMLNFYKEMGFKDLRRRLESRLSLKTPTSNKPRQKRESAVIPKPEDYADVPF